MRDLERRMTDVESAHADLRAGVESRALIEHEHPLPSELQHLNEHLTDVLGEETSPEREPWWNRKLFRLGNR